MVKRFGVLVMMGGIISLGLQCTHAPDDASRVKDRATLQINAVATIGMIADIVKIVGGDYVAVNGLMGPGVDPHLYKASAGDVGLLRDAEVIFYNGLHLEAKMGELFEKMASQDIVTVAVTKDIDRARLLAPPEFEGNYDPHVWFDVTLWMSALSVVVETLSELRPPYAEIFSRNGTNYLNELRKLHKYVLEQARTVPKEKRVLITAHDAFNYFGRAYGFEVKGLQGISTATEAGTRDVQNLAEFVLKRKIPAIFVESSVSTRHIEAVQAAVQAKGFAVSLGDSLFSDAMGDSGTPEGTYIGMVRYNINTIVSALRHRISR